MKPYHPCKGRRRRTGYRCRSRGVVIIGKFYYCRRCAPKKELIMDDTLKIVMTKVAEHIIRQTEGSRGRSIALAEQSLDFTVSEICRILDEPLKNNTKLATPAVR